MITLITDIDGTLLGDPVGLAGLNGFINSNMNAFRLVYATGRNYDEFMDAVENGGLIEPEAVVLATGSEVRFRSAGAYKIDTDWSARMGATGFNPARIMRALGGIKGLMLQPVILPNKVSYVFTENDYTGITAAVYEKLAEAGLDTRLIASHSYYLDVLPKGCDKGKAAQFVCERNGIDLYDVVVAGDSENDLDLLLAFYHGIMVGNARRELREALEGRDIYRAKQGFAAGVLEGLKHFIADNKLRLEP
ncbi:MAG: HAD family hydrolase [Spirochaetia bacterium]|nr:HAD family hydrolase [Spirochaetia bacterium]